MPNLIEIVCVICFGRVVSDYFHNKSTNAQFIVTIGSTGSKMFASLHMLSLLSDETSIFAEATCLFKALKVSTYVGLYLPISLFASIY
jgi:hypothetical protein